MDAYTRPLKSCSVFSSYHLKKKSTITIYKGFGFQLLTKQLISVKLMDVQIYVINDNNYSL